MTRRVTVRGLIIKDNTIFGVRHKKSDGTPKSFWCTPGGGLDPKESLLDGVSRELIEETGVTPRVGKLLLIQQFSSPEVHPEYGHDEELEFFFHIENNEDFETIDLSATTHGDIEIAEHGFVDPKEVMFLPKILQTIDLSELVTKNSPVISSEL